MSETEALRALDAAAAQAVNDGDAGAAAACYTADAALMPPGAPIMKGQDAIRTYWQAAIDGGLTDVVLNAALITVTGDEATVAGTLTGRIGDQALTGKYMIYCRKGPDGWKMHVDIWNFDA